MKRTALLCLGLAVVFGTAATAMAQRPEGGRPPGGPRGERDFGPPPNPLMEAIDTNKDGELSAEEISNAAIALRKLDKNQDGKLSREELRPPRGERGRGFGGRGGDPAAFVSRLMEMDANKDGKITKDELPERMQRIMERADSNKDGVLDKAELEAMARRFSNRGGRGGEGGRGRGGRGGEGGEGGDRPRRSAPDA